MGRVKMAKRRNPRDSSHGVIGPTTLTIELDEETLCPFISPDWLQKPRLLFLDINDIFSLPEVYINLCKSRLLSLSFK